MKCNNYYVYAYINKKNGIPYYIGKGKNQRAYSNHGYISVPKNKTYIVFLEKNLTEIGAMAIERRMIRWFGRKTIDLNGVLLNTLEGGEDMSTLIEMARNANIGARRSEASRKRMSIAQLKSPNHATRGKKRPEFAKLLKGNTFINKGGISPWKGKKRQEVICPHCNKVGAGGAMKQWHFDNCRNINGSI